MATKRRDPDHPPASNFKVLLEGRLEGAASLQVVAHWLSGCPSCKDAAAELTGVLQGPGSLPDPELADYDSAIDRAFAFVLAKEQQARLLEEEVERGLAAFSQGFGPYWTLELPPRVRVEVELRRSWEQRFTSPAAMLAHAKDAVVDADLYLEAEDCGGVSPLEDLRARAHGECANAWRANDNFAAATEQINRAFGHWRQGSGDELIEAHLHWVHGGILAHLHHFDRAQKALDHALRIYHRHRLPHSAGRTLIAKGSYHGDAQEPERAVALLRRGLRLIDTALDPTLELAARFNLVTASVELGRLDDAHKEVWGLAARFEQMGQPMNALRARWLQGRIYLRRGDHERADREYTAARDGFLERGHPYDTALLSFELAVLRRESGQGESAQGLLLEAIAVFQSYDLREYTLAALHLFQRSFRNVSSSVELLLRMISDLDGAIRRSKARAAQAQMRGER